MLSKMCSGQLGPARICPSEKDLLAAKARDSNKLVDVTLE